MCPLIRYAAETKGGVHVDPDIHYIDHPIPIQIVGGRFYTQGFIDDELHVHHVRQTALTDAAGTD